jgi:hypothetical protein
LIEIGFANHDGDVTVLKVGGILLQEPGRSSLHLARPVIDPAFIGFAQLAEPCQKRGKVGSVKQRLLAELDAFKVTPQQLGELVIATGADSLSVDELAGALIVLTETKDAGKREAWARRGAAFFQSRARRTAPAAERHTGGARAQPGGAQPSTGSKGAA